MQLQLLSQKQNPLSEVEDSDINYGEELDFHRSYGRPKLVKIKNLWDDDTELPDHILSRLVEIREQALQKYREVCYNKA